MLLRWRRLTLCLSASLYLCLSLSPSLSRFLSPCVSDCLSTSLSLCLSCGAALVSSPECPAIFHIIIIFAIQKDYDDEHKYGRGCEEDRDTQRRELHKNRSNFENLTNLVQNNPNLMHLRSNNQKQHHPTERSEYIRRSIWPGFCRATNPPKLPHPSSGHEPHIHHPAEKKKSQSARFRNAICLTNLQNNGNLFHNNVQYYCTLKPF